MAKKYFTQFFYLITFAQIISFLIYQLVVWRIIVYQYDFVVNNVYIAITALWMMVATFFGVYISFSFKNIIASKASRILISLFLFLSIPLYFWAIGTYRIPPILVSILQLFSLTFIKKQFVPDNQELSINKLKAKRRVFYGMCLAFAVPTVGLLVGALVQFNNNTTRFDSLLTIDNYQNYLFPFLIWLVFVTIFGILILLEFINFLKNRFVGFAVAVFLSLTIPVMIVLIYLPNLPLGQNFEDSFLQTVFKFSLLCLLQLTALILAIEWNPKTQTISAQ